MGRPPFKGKKKKPQISAEEQLQLDIRRIRMPKQGEVFGILEQRVGGSRSKVRCLDGKTRICRIPGRLKRRLWVRQGDLVLVEPWEHGGDEKGDIIFKYKPTQVKHLRKMGTLKSLDEFEEF